MTTETKPLCVVRAPCTTRSGYGDMSRDIIRHLIEYNKFDVKVISVNWGETPMNALDENNPKDKMILDRIVTSLNKQPELFVTITIPSEFEPLGKYNIGITAGIETTLVAPQWVESCNKMNVVFAISEHAKNVIASSKYGKQNERGQALGTLELTTPIEVLPNCIDQSIFKKLEYEADVVSSIKNLLNTIPEKFCYLFVGHWLRGDLGEDRKNVGLLVKIFLETFKQVKDVAPPALILKTSGGNFSILDKREILNKIQMIRNSVQLTDGQSMPNVYVLHGELTDEEMNSLYNHPKVKAHISLTKGEGFGRPLLEASISGKPVIASGWSGHMDFLNAEDSILVGGELKQLHPSSVWDNILIKESSWFYPDIQQCANALAAVLMDYETFRKKAHKLGKENFRKFSYQAIQKKTWELLDKYVPEFPKQVPLVLPKLKKVSPNTTEVKFTE